MSCLKQKMEKDIDPKTSENKVETSAFFLNTQLTPHVILTFVLSRTTPLGKI